MSRPQQSSIRSFFQPRSQPAFAAPPSSAPLQSSNNDNNATRPTPPPAPLPTPSQPAASKPVTISVTFPPNGIPVLPSPPSLPTGATIVPLAEQHIPALRRINSLLLPVAYPDSFYAKALDPLVSGLFSRAILWQDSDNDAPKVVGGLICRLEPNPFLDAQGQPLLRLPPPPHKSKPSDVPLNTPYFAIYIQSLVLLSPYRSLGLAAAALEHIVASAALFPAAGSNIDTRTIYAHVWTENEEGLKWYEARGFAREGREPVRGYYFKLRPDTAWVVRRHIGPSFAPVPFLPLSENTPPLTAMSPNTATNGTNTKTGAGAVLAAAINLPPITATSTSPPPPPPTTTGPPRRPPISTTASSSTSSLSFQNARPDTEWNDLPTDMVNTARSTPPSNNPQQQQQQQLLPPPPNGGSRPGSGASSRSSSTTGRKKRERAYPTAAFGK